MNETTKTLLQIYVIGYLLGLAPFFVSLFFVRRLKVRAVRATVSALIAATTSTPIFFVPGWFAVFLPISLGYWIAPNMLLWTFTQVIPEAPWIHLASLAATLLVGFLVGWLLKPSAVNNSLKPKRLRDSA